MTIYDEDINLRLSLFYKEIFEKYEKLSLDDFDNLRIYIESIFRKLRPTQYKNEDYRDKIYDYLYPTIYLVGLCNLYSKNKYIQYSFLIKVNNEIEEILNKDIKTKKKIK